MKVALALVALLLAPALPAQEVDAALPEGCERVDSATVACRWTFEPLTDTAQASWVLPIFPRTLATIGVTLLQAPDQGWRIWIATGAHEHDEILSQSRHPARPTTALRHAEESTHVVEAREGAAHWLAITAGYAEAGSSWSDAGSGGGRYEITYVGRLVPAGTVPLRPAATAQAPHIEDDVAEVARPAWDIRRAWWNDDLLGDGLMEVSAQVSALEGLSEADFAPPITSGYPGPSATERSLLWRTHWRVLDTPYFLEWRLHESEASTLASGLSQCTLHAEVDATTAPILAHPLCTVDVANATLRATFPTATIGSPADGELFQDLRASTAIEYGTNAPDSLDNADKPTFLFALGGPRVWDELNACRFCPATKSWYQDPLAAENVADTLQVLGTLAALATFLVGLALVWRRRRHTADLLARVDVVAEQHADQRGALLALGRLEEEFAQMFRRHRISDGQYQVLSQRIATVATRFALRTSLGLDDGVPGEASPARRVDVIDARDTRVRP